MDKYVIIMYSDYGNTIVKKIRFVGNYQEARFEANRLLYANDNYTSFNIEMDF